MKKTIGIVLTLAHLLTLPASARQTTATFYSDWYVGRTMANGQRFYQSSNSVAYNGKRLGSKIRICHKGRCVTGVVRDRCNCTIDLSKGLFKQLAPLSKGRIPVTIH
jgi:rare lipoprotein A (peptidoglycan hydrolase)